MSFQDWSSFVSSNRQNKAIKFLTLFFYKIIDNGQLIFPAYRLSLYYHRKSTCVLFLPTSNNSSRFYDMSPSPDWQIVYNALEKEYNS